MQWQILDMINYHWVAQQDKLAISIIQGEANQCTW